jgi:DNA-binding NarL/FixJ family response regulator
MNTKCRIIILDKRPLFRAAMRALLYQDPDIEIVGEASNRREAMQLIDSVSPQLVLMDLVMPSSIRAPEITEMKRRYPRLRFLTLGLYKSDGRIEDGLMEAADGSSDDATYQRLRLAILRLLTTVTSRVYH